MAILVFVESAEGKIKKTSIEAVAFAYGMGGPVTAIALGTADKNELESLGKYGAQKVLHAIGRKTESGHHTGLCHRAGAMLSRMKMLTYWYWPTPRWELP